MSAHRIVIAGGGIAGLEAAVALRGLGPGGLEITLLSPERDFTFRALGVAEPFGHGALHLPLDEILAGLDVRHVADTLVEVAPGERRVLTPAGGSLEYDGLLLAVGGTPFPAYAHGITFDRPGDPEPFDEMLTDAEQRLAVSVAFVVPDASGWTLPAYDLALMLRAWALRHDRPVRIDIVTAERAPLEAFGATASATVAEVLAAAAIRVVAGAEPVIISNTSLLAGSHWLTADRLVSLPRLAGPRVRGLPCDDSGFVAVGVDGAVPGAPGVYAAGDGAAHPRKQGGLAAQQADAAARALLREAGAAVAPASEPPVLRGVLATPDGPLFLQAGTASGDPGRESIASPRPLWHPPTKVATRWLGPHLDGLVARRLAAFGA